MYKLIGIPGNGTLQGFYIVYIFYVEEYQPRGKMSFSHHCILLNVPKMFDPYRQKREEA